MTAVKASPSQESGHGRWLEAVRAIALGWLETHHADLYLFGSRVRGTHRAASDIDLAVDPHGELSRAALSDLRERLEESTVPLHVDVLDLRDAGPGLRARVLREGVRWNASKSA